MENTDLLECPYNKAHKISANKMPYHVMKCRKNYPTMYLVVCPFDACHEVQRAELKYHMLTCPKRVLLERDITIEALHSTLKGTDVPLKKGYTELPRYRNCVKNICDDQESWDTDSNPSSSRCAIGDSQQVVLCGLRWPFSHGRAAELSASAISGRGHYSMTTPRPEVHGDRPGGGRGQVRPPHKSQYTNW